MSRLDTRVTKLEEAGNAGTALVVSFAPETPEEGSARWRRGNPNDPREPTVIVLGEPAPRGLRG